MKDRSLDEFVDPGDVDSDQDGGDAAVTSSGVDEPDESPADVEPAVSTAVWDGDGWECAACGETAPRRWQGDSGLVCPDCKEW